MSERKIYRAGAQPAQRRKEWVSLPDGDLCVWEMTVAESTQILDRSGQPGADTVAAAGRGRAVVLQIMLSCYDGDEDGARRIFSDADYAAIYAMSFREFDLILQAINRANGKDATERELLQDFTAASEAQNTSPLPSGVSSI